MLGKYGVLLDSKVKRIINSFNSKSENYFTIKSVSLSSKVAITSTTRILKKLIKAKFIIKISVGKNYLYKKDTNFTADLSEFFIDSNEKKILSVVKQNPKKLFHIKLLSDISNSPTTSTYRIVRKLSKHNLIQKLLVGKREFYTLIERDDET